MSVPSVPAGQAAMYAPRASSRRRRAGYVDTLNKGGATPPSSQPSVFTPPTGNFTMFTPQSSMSEGTPTFNPFEGDTIIPDQTTSEEQEN